MKLQCHSPPLATPLTDAVFECMHKHDQQRLAD